MAYWKKDYLDAKINDITRRIRTQEEQDCCPLVFTNKNSDKMLKNKRSGRKVEDGLLEWGKQSQTKKLSLRETLTPKFQPQLCKKSLDLAKGRSHLSIGQSM
jgi:hypothetical protein